MNGFSARVSRFAFTAIAMSVAAFLPSCDCVAQSEPEAGEQASGISYIQPVRLRTVVRTAFSQTHEGWSCDEVILDDRLHTAFIAAVQQQLPGASVEQCGWTLLNLRKAGNLNVETTKRQRIDVADITHIAEIAARSVQDQFNISTDRIMVTPEARAEFDAIVLEMDSSIDVYLARRAAFKMRKQRQLRPELITRIADWGRRIESHKAADIIADATLLNEHPGIYIFRDETGYLYIGQTDNLRDRVLTHLDQSHSASLTGYLLDRGAENITIEVHDFAPDSRARETMVRRAYESELISSRQPRFNIQP